MTSSSTATTTAEPQLQSEEDEQQQHDQVIAIAGGGIVGLVLALALKEHLGILPIIYERASGFHPDVGAGMGMYPNGLKVIRDISQTLLHKIQSVGYPYGYRKWERHDGTTVARAEEAILNGTSSNDNDDGHDDDELQSIGIRRWKLQQVLYEAVLEQHIPIYFDKQIVSIHKTNDDDDQEKVQLEFADGTTATCDLLFAADGSKSTVRQMLFAKSKLEYTGITCVMGMANMTDEEESNDPPLVLSASSSSSLSTPTRNPNDVHSKNEEKDEQQDNIDTKVSSLALHDDNVLRGISFPSALTTQCHGCYFPTSESQLCFQMHFPVSEKEADPGNWGTLSQAVGRAECAKLAHYLHEGGWHDKYVQPLEDVTHAVRIGFCTLQPPLQQWTSSAPPNKAVITSNAAAAVGTSSTACKRHNIVLVGDAAHPPIPYTGQGAQMGLEDAGALALILKAKCLRTTQEQNHGNNITRTWLDLDQLDDAMRVYERIRIPRTAEINGLSSSWGESQLKLCNRGELYTQVGEEKIRRQVFFHETLPLLIPGSTYDYKTAVEEGLMVDEQQQERAYLSHDLSAVQEE